MCVGYLAPVVGWLLIGAGGASSPALEVTAREYQLFVDWQDGREDTRLSKYDDEVKLKKIAQSLGASVRELKDAIAKVQAVAHGLKAEVEKAMEGALQETPLKKQVVSVEVNTDTAHVVAWVKWRCGDTRDHEREASWVAWSAAQGGPVVTTLGLWCVNEIDTKLFSAKIGRDAFTRIDKSAIDRFASTRYIKLFEEVKRGPHR